MLEGRIMDRMDGIERAFMSVATLGVLFLLAGVTAWLLA